MSGPYDPPRLGEPGDRQFGQQPGYGQPPPNQQPYGQQPQHGQQQPYQQQYQQYEQQQHYGQQPLQQYGQQQFGYRQDPAPRNRNRLIAIVAAVVVLVVAAVTVTLVLVNSGDDPASPPTDQAQITQVLNDFVSAADKGDLTKAAALTCAAKRAGVTNQDKPTGSITVDKIENIAVDGDAATADVTLTIAGVSDTSTVNLVKEQGSWKQCGSADDGDN